MGKIVLRSRPLGIALGDRPSRSLNHSSEELGCVHLFGLRVALYQPGVLHEGHHACPPRRIDLTCRAAHVVPPSDCFPPCRMFSQSIRFYRGQHKGELTTCGIRASERIARGRELREDRGEGEMPGWGVSHPDTSRNADVTRSSDISRTQSGVIEGRFIVSLDIRVCLDQSGLFPHTGGSLWGHLRLA